jgi:arginine decarboxylase
MHAAMVELNLPTLVGEACDEDFDPVLTPAQTYQKLLRHETEKTRFSNMAGRIAAVMLVPYPPGIPMSMPGERLGGNDSPVIRLILAMEEFGKRFPGFERETHGIEVDSEGNYWMRSVIEATGKKRNGNGNGKNRPPSSAPPLKRIRKPKPPAVPSSESSLNLPSQR